MIRSRTKFKSISLAFRSSSHDEHEMMVQVARLSVLYEDLQLEFAGSEGDAIKELDRIGRDARRFYFVRRTLATLVEIDGAMHKLNMNREFKRIKRGMAAVRSKAWDDAVKKFAKHHDFLNEWRNDVGGHFLDRAAAYAIKEIHPDTIGAMEFFRRGTGADVKMPFSYELVAMALIKKRKATQPEKEFLEQAFTVLVDLVGAAVKAIHVVVEYTLADRFN